MRSLWSLFAVSCLATLYISCGGDPKPDDSGDSGDSAGSI
jgi:hypothetical protein